MHAYGAPTYGPTHEVSCGACGDPCGGYYSKFGDGYPAAGPSWLTESFASMHPMNSGWKIDVGGVYMERVPPTRTDFGIWDGGEPLFLARDLHLGWASGPRIAASKQLDACGWWHAQVIYFGIDGWDLSRDVPTTTDTVWSDAKLYNVEVNVTRRLTPRLSALAGYRWMEAGDSSQVNHDVLSQRVQALNQMNGFQIGLSGENLWSWRRLSLNSDVKAGIFGNVGTSRQSLMDGSNVESFDRTDPHVAFVGDLAVDLQWRPLERLTTYVGYQAMWFDSAALAPNQVGHDTVNFAETSIYHGLRGGMTFCW